MIGRPWVMIILGVLAFAGTGSGAFGLLTLIRHQAAARAERAVAEIASRGSARSEFACVWGRDLDRDRLEDATVAAAQAVGLRLTDLSVEASPGANAGTSRILMLDVKADGAFETVIGFLRLAVFEKPALAIQLLRIDAADGGMVAIQIKARAECAY